ncbi:MAG TPA: hypothetical protein VF634_07380, partial [Pyrinomonadaceae bacterium]
MLVAPETVARATAATRGGLFAASRLAFGGDTHAPYDPAPFGDEPEQTKKRPRALVVDDAPDVTEMLAILLQYAGYEVVM